MNTEYTGKKIVELRKEKNLTQKELANKLHVTDKAVSKWERGINFPDLGLMEELAVELDTTPSILLGLENVSKEEVVTTVTKISNQQSEEAEKDIQKTGWVNLFAGIFLIFFMYFIDIKLQRNFLFFESQTLLWCIYGLIVVVAIGALYTLKKYKAIQKFKDLDILLVGIAIMDVFVFLAIQFFTGTNPNYIVSSILIGMASVCVQLLFYRVMKPQFMKALPIVMMLCWLCWGILLEVSKFAWRTSNIGDLLVGYILPALCDFITWFICRKRERNKENQMSAVKIYAGAFLIVIVFLSLFGQKMLAQTYVKVFCKQLEVYAEELLDKANDLSEKGESVDVSDGCLCIEDRYGFWNVICYPEDELVEFYTGGDGLVSNSKYLGFYYSSDNTHKVYQGAEVSLNVNKDLADWYGEGDNWGKSTRIIDKWFWFEANF